MNFTFLTTTSFIAVYGAVLSTIALIWNIYNKFQDKPKVKVTASFGGLILGKPSGTKLIVTAVNKGKRSIYLSSVGLQKKEGVLLHLHPYNLPFELKSNTSHSEWFDVDKKLKGVLYAWYRDQTGKVYKSKNLSNKINAHFESRKEKNGIE